MCSPRLNKPSNQTCLWPSLSHSITPPALTLSLSVSFSNSLSYISSLSCPISFFLYLSSISSSLPAAINLRARSLVLSVSLSFSLSLSLSVFLSAILCSFQHSSPCCSLHSSPELLSRSHSPLQSSISHLFTVGRWELEFNSPAPPPP